MDNVLWNLLYVAMGVATILSFKYFYGTPRETENSAMRRHVNRVGQQDGWRM